jgi:endoglucanase
VNRGVVAAVVAVLLALAPTSLEASAEGSAPTPVVSGNTLIDTRTGAAWTAHAVNWPSFEYACQQGWAYASELRTPAAAEAMSSWGINAVRLPLNQACWLGVDGSPAFGTVAGYRAAIADWVATLNEAGLVVILDLHWSAPAGYPANGQRAMPDAQSVTFWQQVAAAYATNASVLFDLYNEPYSRWNSATSSWAFQLSWTCWRDGGCAAPVENDQTGTLSGTTYSVAGMAALVAAVRGAGAAQPILLGGIDYANDLRGWLAHRPADTQLVASWHNYPGQRCNSAACWNAEIAPVAAEVPVIATEFGQTDGGSSFLTTFMTWADAHDVGYAPWAWWLTTPEDGTAANLYALIADSDFTPRAPAGTAYYEHLQSLAPPWSGTHTLRGEVSCATPCRGASGVFSPAVLSR